MFHDVWELNLYSYFLLTSIISSDISKSYKNAWTSYHRGTCPASVVTKFGDPLFKCKDGGERLKEDMLKLTIRRSRIVMLNSLPLNLWPILKEEVAVPILETRRKCKLFKKCLPIARKSQFDKLEGKMGSPFTVYQSPWSFL